MQNGKQELVAIMERNEKNRKARIRLEETFAVLDNIYPILRNNDNETAQAAH